MELFFENIENLIIESFPISYPPLEKDTAGFFDYVVNNIIDKY